MLEKRIQFSNIVHNQLPAYAREEFPLVAEFLSEYYRAQEFQGSPIDLIQNIDKYIKVDKVTHQIESVFLINDITTIDDTIIVTSIPPVPPNPLLTSTGTDGFPEKYGLLKINDEIITYTGKTFNSFTGCIRGFSGVSSYVSSNKPDQLIFSKTEASDHFSGSIITNLSSLFLKEFLLKIKRQLTPGFENREFIKELNDSLFIKQSKDFYRSKGTDQSFQILFKSLYGENVSIIRPKEYLFRPSDAQFQITNDLVVESIAGNPEDLENNTLYQNEYLNFTKAYAPISKVERITSKEGKEYYKLSIDANYNRDIVVNGAQYGQFNIHSQTKVIGQYTLNSFVVTVTTNPGAPPPNNVYVINGVIQQQLTLLKGNTYRFDTSNLSNTGHPFIFQKSSGAALSSIDYLIITNGVSGQVGSFVDLTIRSTAPNETIKYNCSNHNGMGANITVTTDSINGLTTLDVDSTIGFPLSGELFVIYNDKSTGVIQYTSKSINQFFGCSNITGIIEDSSVVSVNTYANNENESIKVRITSVLSGVNIIDDTFYLKKNNVSDIKTLGINSEDFISNNWFFNISPSYQVESIFLIDDSDKTYKITTKVNHILKIADTLRIKGSDNVEKNCLVSDITSNKSFNIKGQGELLLSDTYTVQKNILKTNSISYPSASIFSANIQNIYRDKNKTLIASPSLPFYENQSLNISSREIIFSGTFNSDIFKITTNTDHGFYTGDSVYYTPEKTITQLSDDNNNISEVSSILSSLFDEGIYFIKRIDSNTIKLAVNRSDIYNSRFISVDSPVTVNSNKIGYYIFNQKTLTEQKLLREINFPINDGGVYTTEPGFTGILINGVEILNYKSRDIVYAGTLTEVEVTGPGQGYDIINPPILSITDPIGTGATGYCAVRGSLQEIRIIDPGFDYDEVPVIKITGGNGIGAKAFANMKLIDHQSIFSSEINSSQISLVNNTIGFTTYHKFKNAEQIIYNTNNQKGVGGLSTDALYYVSVQSPIELKLHKTLNDAVSGIGTVQFTFFGIGNHSLRSFNKKLILGSVNIENSGFGYENKKRTVFSNISGINTSINQINILNHDFIGGEIIKYSTSGSIIGGLTNNTQYYVNVVDTNSFKLSGIGTGSIAKDFYYNTRQFINLTSIGAGSHIFNYPEISVEVIGNVGGVIQFKADVQPIFRGEITSIHLDSGGVNYGSPEILNHNRQATIRLLNGSGAQVTPIISDGKIIEVLIDSSGSGYNSPPNLNIFGKGIGAVLTPIVENGAVVKVKVIESGIGYFSNTTTVVITASGSLAKFSSKIQIWNVNLFEKSLAFITEDDGILSKSLNESYGLQYSHLYAPRKLREIVYATDQDKNTLYGRKDLRKSFNKEINSTDHSPIIGWAYDGNPIYGPYGYLTKQGGIISQMKSGFRIDLKPNRPSLTNFPQGFFVQDYTHYSVSDETVLDENNGRFCITPEYPNGTYAYFSTINNGLSDSSGTFSGYKRPEFPFFIGNNFKSRPNEFNFKKSSNQEDIDLNQTNWSRNTTPYNLTENGASYNYLELPNSLNQSVKIKFASPGSIEKIEVILGGSEYKIGDKVVFDNEGTQGFNASAEVERILGKPTNTISVASTTVFGVEFYPSGNQGTFIAFAENAHNFINLDTINLSGFNTTSSLLEGSYKVGVTSNTVALTSGIGSTSVTGIITYFSVAGNLNYPNIRENDILGIGTEKIKILNVDLRSSRIRVLRAVNGTVGSSHSVTDILYENSRKLTINAGFRSQYDYKLNREIYFNPSDAVGLGTTSGIGIGVTLIFSNPGTGITEIFIPTRSIYISNHKLNTGDELIYSTNSGSPIGVSTNGISTSVSILDQSIVYVAKISDDLIGISTFKVGIGTQGTFVGITSNTSGMGSLFFTNIGTGNNHSFKTTYNSLVGNISRNTVTVSSAQTHGLLNNDIVFVDVNPSISTTFSLKYNDYNRKLLLNPKDFISAGINTLTSTITINNHGFVKGQKVIHTSSVSSIGLENNKEYYVTTVDNNNIRLTNSYFESVSSKPSVVGIISASNGTLSLINPPIDVYRNSSVIFDLSDSSLSYIQQSIAYPAFDFRFFKDSNLTEIYDSSADDKVFEVQKIGVVGVTSDAKVTLNVNKETPKNLYYNLIPIYNGTLPENKKLINVDSEVIFNNEIQVKSSVYNGVYNIKVGSTTSFTYTISTVPEKNIYTSDQSIINYETISENANGAISKIKIINRGQNYYSLPQITSLISEIGTGSILEPVSRSIGKIKTTRIKDIGFNFPSDFTARPSISIPQVIKVDPLSSLESIEIISFGRGYTSAPKLLVLDGGTGKVVPEVDLKITLDNNKVEILKNSFALNNVTPIILPIQNSNGVGISSIQYNSNTKDVTVVLSVGFSTTNSFPFAINDKILIENISVGVGSTGKGYNSENYNYQLFTITSVVKNLGGLGGSVTYNLNEFLSNLETPGVFDSINSSGRIIPKKYFPTFDIVLRKNNYLIGEKILSGAIEGRVEDWDSKSNLAKIISKNNFKVDEVIKGLSSQTQGIILNVNSFEAFFNLSAVSKFENGWKSSAGFLNDNIQRIQDSFYYQNFSYSIKSRVSFDTWNDVVSTLNHTSGFKKFSDYQLESNLSVKTSKTLIIRPNNANVEVVTDIIGVVNLNCVYDFDLVRENSLQIGSQIFSDEIIFSNRILTDYAESVGNRVLSIDDISSQFNNNPRPTRFSEVHRFNLEDVRAQKYLTYVRDKRYTGERQLLIVTSLIDNIGNVFLNQYARVESTYDMGSFDITIDGTDGVLLFYPTKFSINDFDITTLSYNINDNLLGIGSTTFGGVVDIRSSSVAVSAGTTTTIIGIASTYRSMKVLVSISATTTNQYEFDELNIIHNGTDVGFVEYGQLTNHSLNSYSSTGLGTYYPYLSGGQLKVDFTPNVQVTTTVNINAIQVAFASTTTVGVGTYDMKHARLEGRSTSIASTSTPTPISISSYPDIYDSAYFIVQISDNTNNNHQLSEVALIDDDTNVYVTEYGVINTLSGLGTIGAQRTSSIVELTFTPLANIDVDVKVYLNALRYEDDDKDVIDFLNSEIQTDYGTYEGTDVDIKRAFNLTHKNDPIFERYFIGSSSEVVNANSDTIFIPNHFFVTGEEVEYINAGTGTIQAIGIATTSFVSVGSTDKLPEEIYVVKIDISNIKLARSAEDALKIIPKTLDITNVGIGTLHKFVSTNQNAKVIVALDNLIQSPIVSSATTTTLANNVLTTSDIIFFNQITSFFGGDLIKIGNEIMRIDGVGIGSTNAIQVRRPRLGTSVAGYSTGSLVTKVSGNYNIVDNVLNFAEAPFGNFPSSSPTNRPDERDYVGISTGSSFQGRSFMRSGIVNSSDETYHKNYIFNDISSGFNGTTKKFTLKSNGTDVDGIENENAVILINDIFQGPGITYDYNLTESVGVTTITFTGAATSVTYDVNNASIPRGGVIVSVGSTEGFGYQPLVSAGGTANISIAGTISAISIGNSGSGYRSGIQVVKVGVALSSTGIPSIEFIGTATVSNGSIVSIAITNPGAGYTSTNPPYVIFDDPLSYSNLPLIYSSGFSGVGTQATVNVVVGQGSSVIDFEIINTGYGYIEDQILTVPIGGSTGIPTTGITFKEFKVTIQKTFRDKFNGWSIGELQVLDNLDNKFDGETVSFPITLSDNLISILSSKGSNINVQDTLLIFINDILQIPGGGYIFPGGSIITFTEPPKIGDTSKILFYRGSGSVDVVDVDILETVKVGDELTIGYNSSLGQSPTLQEEERTVTSINSTDLVNTNPYFGPGNVIDETLERPVVWCRQTEDKIINELPIGKNRVLYEAAITPTSYLIKPVGVGNTILCVDTIRPFFNPINENNSSLAFQNSITIISQDNKVGASATAVVSVAGTISSIVLSNGGVGYTTSPSVSIQNSVGIGTTLGVNATASSTILSDNVTSISITNAGVGYTIANPPLVLIESPNIIKETNSVISYSGDSGVIVGFGTTTISGTDKIIFDFHIPLDSYLRNISIVGSAVTISSISVGDYFLIYGSNIGSASTSITSRDISDNVIGIGTDFVNNVYQVDNVSNIQSNIIGVGTTSVRRIFARISGISTITFSSTNINFDSTVFTFDSTGIGTGSGYSGIITTSTNFGNFSWGKIVLAGRTEENSYNFYGNNGVGGISTSGIVKRTLPLRFEKYVIT